MGVCIPLGVKASLGSIRLVFYAGLASIACFHAVQVPTLIVCMRWRLHCSALEAGVLQSTY